MNATTTGFGNLVVRVREDEDVGRITVLLCFENQLEHVLILRFGGNLLDIGDTLGIQKDLAEDALSPHHLDHPDLFILAEVPVEIFIVVEDRIRSTATKDAVGMQNQPIPKHLKRKRHRDPAHL